MKEGLLMKRRICFILCVLMIISLSLSSVLADSPSGGGGAGSLNGGANSGDVNETPTTAEKLAMIINEMQDGACSYEDDVVTLEDDFTLTETLVIPTGENVILDTHRYDIIASGDFDAIYVPEGASLTVEGRGMIIGGADEQQGKYAINNEGVLIIDDSRLEIIGGGTMIEDEPNSPGGSSGGASGGSSGGNSSGPSSPGSSGSSESVKGGPPGEYDTDETTIPGTVYAQNGGSGVHNEGTLILNYGKIIGGLGTESNGDAISGNITGGECIVHSDNDQDYELISSSSTDKQYVFFREATTAEGLYITFVLSNSDCCEYTYSYDEENEEYTETIKMLKNVTVPSYSGNFFGGSLVLDTNGYTINIVSDEEENSGLYVYYIMLKGNGTINGNVVFGYAIIEEGTINGDLVAESVGMSKLIINGGTVNGSIHTIGGTLEINDGTINGLIEAYSTEVIINGGTIAGGTNSWVNEAGQSRGTIWVRDDNITVNGGNIIGRTDSEGENGYPAITIPIRDGGHGLPHLILNGGSITGGIGTESNGVAVDSAVAISKEEGVIIKESADGKYWTVLPEDSGSSKTYLKAGTQYCISVKNGTAYKSNDLTTPIMEANAGDNITLVADSAPREKMFKEWSISGAEIGNLTNETVTFTMPSGSVVCEAVYMSENWYEVNAGEASAVMKCEDYEMQVIPVSQNQKVFASVRDLADGMGLGCEWNAETQEITFSTDNKQLTYVLGSQNCISYNNTILVDVKAVMDVFLAEDFWVIGDENKVVAKKKTDENTATIKLNAQNGTTTGAGDYYIGSSVTISTTTNSSYSFGGWYEGETQVSSSASYTFIADADKTFVAKSTRNRHSGGAIAMTLSQIIKNADGTTTTVTIDKKTGKSTKTTNLLDGSVKVEEIFKDGIEKVTLTDKNGNTEITTKYPDGTKITEKKVKNGVSVKAVTSVNNEVSASVTGINDTQTKIVIPVEDVSDGTVAVIVRDDGTEQVLKNCLPTQEGLSLCLLEDAELKIVDRSKDFADTKGHWATDSIDFVIARDLFNGTSKEEFSPNTNMTRGMVAVVLHNYENNPEFEVERQFQDIAQNSWYSEAVSWLYDKGVVSGYDDNTFGAEDHITREQLVTLLYRYAGNPQHSETDIIFDDADEINEYAKTAVIWSIENGIINGKNDNKFDPKGIATRAECAAIIQRFIKAVF